MFSKASYLFANLLEFIAFKGLQKHIDRIVCGESFSRDSQMKVESRQRTAWFVTSFSREYVIAIHFMDRNILLEISCIRHPGIFRWFDSNPHVCLSSSSFQTKGHYVFLIQSN